MTSTQTSEESTARATLPSVHTKPVPPIGVAGGPGTRLLAGPPRSEGPESLAAHENRLGPLVLDGSTPEELRAVVRDSGLLGRGGGQFPVAIKLEVAAASPGTPLVVVNASEGEPASRKDRTLLELRPHLVLDGAEAVARATGADEIVVYLHRGNLGATESLERAIADRGVSSSGRTRVRVVDAPSRYVAGETSAVVSVLEGGGATPRRASIPVAGCGVGGRPTVVSNVETLGHLALIARFGADWFSSVGARGAPGSTLVTLSGAVAVPGLVVEVLGPVLLGEVLETVGGLDGIPRAVLLGGYGGSWIAGDDAWWAPLERSALGATGLSLGCGLVAVLGDGRCGLAETARLLNWLAGQSAGQCGPCVLGLPELGRLLGGIVAGSGRRRDLRRLREVASSVRGRGDCGHPTGAVTLLESALDTFEFELGRHLRGHACRPVGGPGRFPLPRGPAPR